jgi:hypothetical protein
VLTVSATKSLHATLITDGSGEAAASTYQRSTTRQSDGDGASELAGGEVGLAVTVRLTERKALS